MEMDGARLRYLRAGAGPALILLHGLLGYSFSWRYTMPALAPYATVYAPDLLGAGFSDRPAGLDHSMRATALRILRFVRGLGVSSFDLLGTSHGGAVAMMVAAECLNSAGVRSGDDSERPDNPGPPGPFDFAQGRLAMAPVPTRPVLRRLVLVAPVNPFSKHGRRLAPLIGSRFGSSLFRLIIARMTFTYPYWHARMYGDRSRIPPGTMEGYMAPLAAPGMFEHALSIVSTWTRDLRELQANLPGLASVPALLMWGGADGAVYASSAQPLAKFFPNSKVVMFPGIGHLPYEECPEEFNRALIEFLTCEKLPA
jgi:pimeloyl-ACP methyl ester carboxylesterase